MGYQYDKAMTVWESAPLQDHPLSDKRAGRFARPWHHVRVCIHCLEVTGHEEFMTKICLSCGQKMSWFPRDAAVRMVVQGGEWREHLHDNGLDYLREGDRWVLAKEARRK